MFDKRFLSFWDELASMVETKKRYGLVSFKSSVVETDEFFELTLTMPGYSKAKGKFKGSSLVISVEGKENDIIFQLPDDFYQTFDIKTLTSEFKHGIFKIKLLAFPKTETEENDLVHSFEIGYDHTQTVFEVNFEELEKLASEAPKPHKEKLVSLIKHSANGHKVKNLSSQSIIDISNEIANIKEAYIEEDETEGVKVCDLLLNHLEHDLHDNSLEIEATGDITEATTEE